MSQSAMLTIKNDLEETICFIVLLSFWGSQESFLPTLCLGKIILLQTNLLLI